MTPFLTRTKKYAMVIMWRTQQIAGLFTLVMLAINLSLQVNTYIEWRFSNSYIGICLTLWAIATVIYIAGYTWDKKAQMWRQQVQVSVERNPYTTTKMTPKEILNLEMLWIDWLEERGRKAEADIYRRWIAHEKEDPETYKNYKALKHWLRGLSVGGE